MKTEREGVPEARWYLHWEKKVIGKEDQEWHEILQKYRSWIQNSQGGY